LGTVQSARQLEGLAMVAMGVFAVIGFVRGARREWLSLAATLCGYVAVERYWPEVAALVNRLYSLGLDRAVEKVVPVGGPGGSSGAGLLVPVESGNADIGVWQVAVFAVVVLVGYLLSGRLGSSTIGGVAALVRLPDLVDRLVGAVLGAASGYVAATVVLGRLFPDLRLELAGDRSLASGTLARLGPPGVFALVGLVILFGVIGLESRGKRVYG
jgi:uncharacterized membrane protein required for colicin V production